MEEKDFKIAGSGTIASGSYNKISVAGSASSNGNIECNLLKVAGSASFNGDVDAKELSLAGSTKFLYNLKCDTIKIAGAVKVYGNVASELLKIDGAIKIEGECNVGTLNHVSEGSSYNNIYGETINIECKRNKQTTVNEIEATNIELRSVVAKRVSGDNIVVTGKSVIDIIEFKDTLKISKNVDVKVIIKL